MRWKIENGPSVGSNGWKAVPELNKLAIVSALGGLMIPLLLMLAGQPSGPQLMRDERTYVMPSFQVTPEIAPMVDRYYHCAFPDAFGTHQVNIGKEEASVRSRIAACADTRKWAVSAAIAAYKPQPGGEPNAEKFVNGTFDAIDAGQIGMAKEMDEMDAGTAPVPSADQALPAGPEAAANGELVTTFDMSADYPSIARRRGWEGDVTAELTFDSKGRVTACRIVKSSGHAVLDQATCDVLRRKARFKPNGSRAAPVTIVTPPIEWRLTGN